MNTVPAYIKELFPENPDWLYQPAAVDHTLLPEIRTELATIYHQIPDRHKWGPTTFNIVDDQEIIQTHCPVLCEQLRQMKLLKMLSFIGFITVNPEMKFPMHIDNNPGELEIALNIPVENCHDSYTVWYNAEISPNPPVPYIKTIDGSDAENTAMLIDEASAVEIDRFSADVPAWININVPHNLMCSHDLVRVGASLRFNNLHKFWDRVDHNWSQPVDNGQ